MIELHMRNSSVGEEVIKTFTEDGKLKKERKVKVIKGTISATDSGVRKLSNTENVRTANVYSKVAKDIHKTIVNRPSYMVLLNRGITAFIRGKHEYSAKNNVLRADEIYIIDGGTTKSICDKVYEEGLLNPDCVLNLEIIVTEGLTPNEIAMISSSRNTNNPPADYTLANAIGAFDNLQKVLLPHYCKVIDFKQNSHLEKGLKEYLKCEELVRYMMMLDARNFFSVDRPYEKFPDAKSSEASKSIAALKAGAMSYDCMTEIINDVLTIRDYIAVDVTNRLMEWANSDSMEINYLVRFVLGTTGLKGFKKSEFMALCEMKSNSKQYKATIQKIKDKILSQSTKKSLFTQQEYKFDIPKQCIYVFFSGFRANTHLKTVTKTVDGYEVKEEKVVWTRNPDDILSESLEYVWTSLIAQAKAMPGGGMDVICTPAVASQCYTNILGLVLKKD